ncbi:MAG: hypothetical protein V7K53_29370 [Nostoc sp.]|uniref:hypothetical protein n=1 Tax=Nostoc sp. TaxID=1180 RepID=UPI002FF85BF2
MPTFVFIPVKGSDRNTIRLRFFDENYRSQKCEKSSQRHDSSRIVETAIHRVSCSGKIS